VKTLSQLLLELHRLAGEEAPSGFQRAALDAVKRVVRFDSAFWSSMACVDGEWTVHSVYLYDQPAEMILNWKKICRHDPLGKLALANPGKTLNVSNEKFGAAMTRRMYAHTVRYGMAHTLSTLFSDDKLGLVSVISLYRAGRDDKYAERERRLTEALAPHLFETWNLCQVRAAARGSAHERGEAFAVMDRFGVLHSAEPLFATLLRVELPAWTGPRLPPDIVKAIVAPAATGFAGKHVSVSGQRMNDLWFLAARKATLLDALSAKQRAIAREFGRGLAYKDIARRLGLAPSTVRNHLQAIYVRLKIRSKRDLILLVEREQRHS
jgi:DNA-binding CsgD family transcriptional regulator